MRAANFTLAGEGPASADLAVIPLPGTGGSDVDLVNLWRGQLSLPPITEDALPAHSETVEIAGLPTVRLFSIVGTESTDAAAAANQILVATLRREGFTWFFKLSGDAATVASNRERLEAFLGNIEFTAPEAPAMAAVAPMATPPAASSPGEGSEVRWSVPAGWTPVPATQMIHSKWTIATAEGATASVTVSVFPGATGGPVMNLNRWRSQVGLPPAPEAEITPLLDNTEVLGGKATLADFTGSSPESGEPARLVAAIVQRDGKSWFYKLLGAPAAVEAQREAFVRFVQTVQY